MTFKTTPESVRKVFNRWNELGSQEPYPESTKEFQILSLMLVRVIADERIEIDPALFDALPARAKRAALLLYIGEAVSATSGQG